jgi:hypothetical protein
MHVIKPVGVTLASASEAEDDAPQWMSGVAYPLGAKVIRGHRIYVSSIDNNQGIDPAQEVQELVGARWLDAGASNIYRFFEGTLSTRTEGQSPLVLEVNVDDRFSAIALFDLRGSKAKIEVITGGQVKTVADIRVGAEPVGDWLSWLNSTFFNSARQIILPNAHGFATSRVRLTITGESPALGELVIGRRVQIGKTLVGRNTSVRRRTFTEIKTNPFGRTEVKKRAIARDVTYAVVAERKGFEAKQRFLDDVDGVQVVTYAGTADRPEAIGYGFITDYELPLDLPDNYVFEIKTQGVS